MSKFQKVGLTHEPLEDIEDAEFVEIDDHPTSAPRGEPRADNPIPNGMSQRIAALQLWWEGVSLFFKVPLAFAVLFGVIVFAGHRQNAPTVADQNQQAPNSPATPLGDTMSETSDAHQMLAEWTRRVTGTPGTASLNISNGSGAAGSSCNDGDGTHLLQFGKPSGDGLPIDDFFSLLVAGDNGGIAGAFWFDNAKNELVLRHAEAINLKTSQSKPVPDKTFDVSGGGSGTIQLDGERYHACRL